MNSTNYGYGKTLSCSFEEAIEKTKESLQQEGFGILMNIDVQGKMKEALKKDMGQYIILGACNPSFAFEALQAETEIGLLLPCNVIVYEKEGQTRVSAILPTVSMEFIENSSLQSIARTIEKKLKTVIDRL